MQAVRMKRKPLRHARQRAQRRVNELHVRRMNIKIIFPAEIIRSKAPHQAFVKSHFGRLGQPP